MEWIAGGLIMALASCVYGLTGFGIGLVALSLLPFVLPPVTIVPLVTIYGAVLALVLAYQLRRDMQIPQLRLLLLGAVLGTPAGVWLLDTLSTSLLKRLIGVVLVGAMVLLEWGGRAAAPITGRGWSFGAGTLAGVLGGAIATPGPPVILYAMTQGWPPRTMQAMLYAFFLVSYSATLVNHWLVGLVTPEVLHLAWLYALPAALGVAGGHWLSDRIPQRQFRRLLCGILLILGLLLALRG